MGSDLGSYIVNVTAAAEACSRHLCGGNGRCVRRLCRAPHYLHLNPASYRIEAAADGDIAVRGRASAADLALMAEEFSCHCYQGFGGPDCRERRGAEGRAGGAPLPGLLVTLCLLAAAGRESY